MHSAHSGARYLVRRRAEDHDLPETGRRLQLCTRGARGEGGDRIHLGCYITLCDLGGGLGGGSRTNDIDHAPIALQCACELRGGTHGR